MLNWLKKYSLILIVSLGFINSSSAQDSIFINAEEIQILCTQIKVGEYVIRNNIEYQKFLEHLSPHAKCIDYKLPNIDFDKYTLILYKSGVGGCKEPEIKLRVSKKKWIT